uniref:Nad1_b n=1 Tax=Laurentiella strenua TaxID=114681 RepID=A0A2I4PER7_9SPIT|nr:nad1_b [Laurentiella strenua]
MLLDFFFFINLKLLAFSFFLLDTFDPLTLQGFFLLNWKTNFIFPQNLSLFFGIKFCLCISFLILIRGGTPRYRYDYLTKLGWLKFLSLILLVFSFSIFTFFLF